MKSENVLLTIEKFSLDIIGTVIPGGVLLGGVWLALGQPELPLVALPPADGGAWLSVLVGSYILGHFVSSVSRLVEGPVGSAASSLRSWCTRHTSARSHRWSPVEWGCGGARVLFKNIASRKELRQKILDGASFREFAGRASRYFPVILKDGSVEFHAARDLAISLASDEARVFRFRFLSLLNLGVATSILLTLLSWASLSWDWLSRGVGLVAEPLSATWAVLWLVLALFLIQRGFYFRAITLSVPFSMAAVALAQGAIEIPEPQLAAGGNRSGPVTIYLAGGFHSGWQARAAEAWQGRVLDPRGHRLERREEYTLWDLEAIRACDWVVAFLEATNPAGYALALEIGFAKALGKRVIFVDEKSETDEKEGRYLAMLHATADLVFERFEDALEFLRSCDFQEQERVE